MRSISNRTWLVMLGVLCALPVLLNGLAWNRPLSTEAAVTLPAGPADLPGRRTPTPSNALSPALPAAPLTPAVTSPFTFPTDAPELSPTPTEDCTSVFPIESVERIAFGETTIPQLEAAFGRAESRSGRPSRLRFEADGCTLLVTLGVQEALDAELLNYGSLGWLLDRYGPPGAVGISQGNLTLLTLNNAVLLYPEAGILAIFDASPNELDRSMPVSRLVFRPAYTVDKQMTRLNLQPVEGWLPPP